MEVKRGVRSCMVFSIIDEAYESKPLGFEVKEKGGK